MTIFTVQMSYGLCHKFINELRTLEQNLLMDMYMNAITKFVWLVDMNSEHLSGSFTVEDFI